MSRKSSESNYRVYGMSLLVLAVILNLCCCSSTPKFNTYPDYKIYTGQSYGTAIKVSSNSNYVMVGYSTGNARIYYTTGSLYTYCYGHNSSIIDIEEIPYNGWITLDSSGKAIRWSSYGSQQYTWNFSAYPTDISVASSGGYYWVGFNFGSYVLEYNALTNSNTTTKIYYPPTYTYFKNIQYPSGHSYLHAATNTTYVYSYDTYTGNYSSSYLYTYYSGIAMTQVPGGYKQTVLLNNYYILKFRNTSTSDLSSYSESANMVAASYYNGNVVYILASNSSSNLYIHQSYGTLTQTLYPNLYNIRAIDASTTYLCALDYYGYLIIYTFNPYDDDYYPSSGFPGWAIALISSLFFFICVVGIVCMVVRGRKRRQAQMINNYNRFNNQPVNPPYFPNNQPFNPPSGQQISGNTQPAWNSNPQPYFNNYNQPSNQPPVQQNPYQANQPSNWS